MDLGSLLGMGWTLWEFQFLYALRIGARISIDLRESWANIPSASVVSLAEPEVPRVAQRFLDDIPLVPDSDLHFAVLVSQRGNLQRRMYRLC